MISLPRAVTSTDPKRVIYFRGHKDERAGAMISRICMNYETVSSALEGECATRTLLNLYNLQAVRGRLDSEGSLDLKTSMSGPHHYFGYLNPFDFHTIVVNKETILPQYFKHNIDLEQKVFGMAMSSLDSGYALSLSQGVDYDWISGIGISDEDKKRYKLSYSEDNETVLEANATTGLSVLKKRRSLEDSVGDQAIRSTDSLFAYPGIIALSPNHAPLCLPLLTDALRFDLSDYRAQVVRNDSPFRFTEAAIKAHQHAQHRLRVITYFYGPRYVPDYLMKGNGLFIEKHEFIQSITPLSENCGGYVVLGKEVTGVDANGCESKRLELIAVTIPFGQTLLVEPYCIHGDSTLTGKHFSLHVAAFSCVYGGFISVVW
jgi:hypothetical protein